MTDLDALLAGIAAYPEDDTPRLVVADWYDEHDMPERAAFIRLGAGKTDQARLSVHEGRWLDKVERVGGPPQVLKLLPTLRGLAAPHTSVLVSRKGRHVRVRVTVPDRSERGRTLRSCWVNLEYQRGFAVAARYSYAAAFLHTCRAVAKDEPLAAFEPLSWNFPSWDAVSGRAFVSYVEPHEWGPGVFALLEGFDRTMAAVESKCYLSAEVPPPGDHAFGPWPGYTALARAARRDLNIRVHKELSKAMTAYARSATED